MKKILAFITFLLFLLLLWCSNNKYQACCSANDVESDVVKEQITKTPVVKKDGPLVYAWNSYKSITNDLWGAKKNEILSGMADGKILRILGPYFEEEGKEVGIARAKSVLQLLADKVDTSKVELGSKLISFYDDAKTNHFGGTKFDWLTRNDNIQEIDNKTLIYFPYNSTKKLSNANITNYLKDAVKVLKGNTKKVSLSGHTDSMGDSSSNKRLALDRANSIKNELVRLGLSANRITTVSFGEEKPIDTNKTKVGRQKNRRVELEIK
jgi:hypothetical protein